MKCFTAILISITLVFPILSFCTSEETDEDNKSQVSRIEPDKKICEDFIQSGDKLMKKHKYEEALENFEKALLFDPFSSKAYYGLGYCYKKLGKYDKAKKELELGLKYKRDPDSLS